MRRSLPALTRGRSTARSALRRQASRSDRNITDSEEQDRPTFEHGHAANGLVRVRRSHILEASLHADRKPVSGANVQASARTFPTITKTHTPNESTIFQQQDGLVHTAGIAPPRLKSRRPSSQRPSPNSTTLHQDTLPLARHTYHSLFAGESGVSFRSASRCTYSSMSGPVASSSKVRIEDMEGFDMQAFNPKGRRTESIPPPDGSRADHIPEVLQSAEAKSAHAHSETSPRLPPESLMVASHTKGIDKVRLIEPKSPAHMTGILRQAIRMLNSPSLSTLETLAAWHDSYPTMRSTGSYNVLLQLAYDIRHLKAFNQILLKDMPAAGVKRDSITYDLEMESFARHGLWKNVVRSWTSRRENGIPLNAIGWTRLAQAVTKRGTTSLSQENVGTSMSPIYSALYDLPKGVRQMQLHKLTMDQKMDVDQMLALMMPEDLHPLDFHATLAVAHRLAKQLRWRETEDVVALYLDRSAETWDSDQSQSISTQNPASFKGDEETIARREDREMRTAAARRQQSALALLHVLLECLVISRSSPDMVQAYIDNFLVRYENTNVKPEYHTLFFVLTAYRVQPLKNRFRDAYAAFVSLEEHYRPSHMRRTDWYGLSRCLRQLQAYGYSTVTLLKKLPDSQKDTLTACEIDLASVDSRLAEISHLDQKQSQQRRRDRQAIVARQPARHLLLKERYKAQRLRRKKPARTPSEEMIQEEDMHVSSTRADVPYTK